MTSPQAGSPPASAELGDIARLGQLLTVLLSSQAADSLLDDVMWRLAELFRADIVTLADVDRGTSAVRLCACVGLAEGVDQVPPGVALVRAAASMGIPQRFPSPGQEAAPPGATDVRRGVSLPLPGGRLVLSLHRYADEVFTGRDVEVLTVMARHLDSVLEQDRRVRQLTVLAEHGREVDQLTDSTAISAAAVTAVQRLLETDAAAVMDVQGRIASYVVHCGLDTSLTEGWTCAVEDLAAREAVRTREPVVGDVASLSRHPDSSSWRLRAFAAVPLVVGGRTDRLLYAFRRTSEQFSPAEVSVLSLLGSQTCAALERVATLQAAEERRRKAELLRDIGRQVAASLHEGQVLERFGDALLEVTRTERVTVLLMDEDAVRLRVASSRGAGNEAFAQHLAAVLTATQVTRSGVLWDAMTGRAARLLDATAAAGSPLWCDTAPGHAGEVLVQPLVVNDRALGVVLLEQNAGAALDQEERDSVEQLATVAAVALHNAQLYHRVEADRAQLRALHDFTLSIGASDDVTATLQQITDAAVRLTGATRCRLGLRDSTDTYRLAAVTGVGHEVGTTFPLGRGVGGWITRTGETVWTPDMSDGTTLPPEAMKQTRRREGSAAGVPLRSSNGDIRGFLSLRHPLPGQFRRDVVALLERFGAEAVLAIDSSAELTARRRLESRLREQAERDPLTGLANRTLLIDRLGAALSDQQRPGHVAVLYLDLDRFKSVNDSLGHAGGDELLVAVAERLSRLVRGDDLVARLGGDEFVVLVDNVGDASAATSLADRMLDALAQPISAAGSQVFVSASIGVVTVQQDGRPPTSVLQDADIAMYQAKRAGKGRYLVFEPSMRAAAVGRLQVETELREALAEDALVVHYQPLVDLRSKAVVGVEALVRWPHPVRGLVPPDEFIPIAEETGLIARIDEYVLRTAAEQVRRWQELPGCERLRVNVNVSALSLHDEALQHRLATVLAQSGLAPASLVVELTETAAMQDPERSLALCRQIRDLGAQVAIDDFGTGYSNVAHLSRLPVDILKIDRSLVRLLDDGHSGEALVRAALALAAALDLQATAEGIETVEQAQRLQALGCHHGQGHHYSRPLPAQELTALLVAGSRARPAAAVLPSTRRPRSSGRTATHV